MNTPGSGPMARWLEDVWLTRYLDRELNDDEHAWFEAYMLDKQHLLEQVDADTRLRDGVRAAAKSSAPIIATATDPTAQPANARTRRPWLGIAASLLVGLGLGASLVQFRPNHSILVASPPRIVFDTMRGEGATTFSESGNASSKVLIVDIATPLESQILSARAWIDGKQTELPIPVVSSEGFVTFVVPSTWKGQASIELEIGGAAEKRKQAYQL